MLSIISQRTPLTVRPVPSDASVTYMKPATDGAPCWDAVIQDSTVGEK
jgi:hypothetical protein